jgi:hypothetical protein
MPLWLAAFALFALLLTYPLPRHLLTHIPQGSEGVGTVPFFNLWTLQWNIDQLVRGYPHYWDAPIFAPQPGSFAFSEPQVVSGLLAAPLWLASQSPALAYNGLVLLFLTLNGWFAAALLRTWGLSPLAAFLGGLLMQALPFVAQEMGVLQLIAIFGFLWSLFYLNRLLAEPRPTWPSAFGLAVGLPLTFFTCSYYGLFSLFFLPLAFLLGLGRNHWTGRFYIRLLVTGLLIILLSGPFLWSQDQQLAEFGSVRGASVIEANSAKVGYYLNPPGNNLFYGQWLGVASGSGQHLFPGLGLILLAGFGLVGGNFSRVKLYLGLAILLAFLLSLGLRLNLAGIQPYQWVRDWVPGFTQLRSPFRFAMLVQLHLLLLAGFGLDRLSRWRLAYGQIMAVALAGLILLEGLAWPQPLQALPDLQNPAPWQSWLNQQQPGSRIVMLPFVQDNGVAFFEQTTRWMLANRHLNGTMLNGYSGFFPPDHAALRQQMLAFPSPESIALLQQKGADYVVVFEALPQAPSQAHIVAVLAPVYFDEQNQVRVYQMTQP